MKKDNFMKDALILFVITLIAGVCLGGVYEVTAEPIAQAKMAAKAEAYIKVYPTADRFAAADELQGQVDVSALSLSASGLGNVFINEVAHALDASGNAIGYVVTSTSKDGYGGNITVSVGITAEGAVEGIEFLEIKETAGLGMNADTLEFKAKYAGKAVDAFAVVKGGAAADNEIDAISGATVTTNAVTNAVNAALVFVSGISGQ